MFETTYQLIYVRDMAASLAFYRPLLSAEPVESAATFSLFVLADGSRFGLWSHQSLHPASDFHGVAGGELALTVPTLAQLQSCYADWQQQSWPLLQAPTQMDFGTSCVTADPDGHRIRVFVPATA